MSALPGDESSSIRRLESRIHVVSGRCSRHEEKIAELERVLAIELGKSRSLSNEFTSKSQQLRRNKEAVRAARSAFPVLADTLTEDKARSTIVHDQLPAMQTGLSTLHGFYDSGRTRAQKLYADLDWAATPWYKRHFAVLFRNRKVGDSDAETRREKWRISIQYAVALLVATVLAGAMLLLLTFLGTMRGWSMS